MQSISNIVVGQRGVITLPKAIRNSYEWPAGKVLTLIDLDGVLVLSPKESHLHEVAERLASDVKAQGESLEGLISAVRQARARYGD